MNAPAAASLAAIEQHLLRGDLAGARAALDALDPGDDPRGAHEMAQLYMRLKAPAPAARLYRRAVEYAPGAAPLRYNLATALIALGRLEEAEAELDRVIALDPGDGDAWYNRATLRRQTPARNHVAALRHARAHPALDAQAAVALDYALAKELEDLGEYRESFTALARGARARRAGLAYDVRADADIMAALGAAFTPARLTGAAGHADPRPVFVVGLPRSGTTLVERILSAHPQVASHGESTDFALALMHLAGPCASKEALLERALAVDPRALGAGYAARIAHLDGARVVDKTPANFLYLGLIARALPDARIIYVRRHPLDVCYAMYKTLFRMAYPYSYDQDDLAAYWIAFADLMQHWQRTLAPAQLLTVDYEALVADPEVQARRLLAHVGMDWDPACLAFERNPLPVLTASAAQVREPIHGRSVGLWRRYERQLAPLVTRLAWAGVDPVSGERAA